MKKAFGWMLAIVCLLNVNYNILRAARNALVVADSGHGAASIPVFELLGTMPASIVMVYLLTRLLNRFSLSKVFFITLTAFTSFFLFFAFALYPNGGSFLFFIMAELWKIALLTVLFWGLINQYVPLEEAKKYYAPLMLGSSLGTILAGPIISFCTHGVVWKDSLVWMMVALFGIALATALCFFFLSREFTKLNPREAKEKKPTLSFMESVQACFSSRYLSLLGWVTIADYVAYAVGETIFLDIVRQKYPNPSDYCECMGQISSWTGALTALSALVITPYLLKKTRWVVAAMITPVCILTTQAAFFTAYWQEASLDILVLLGAAFFALSRAAKYTLFDSSKEISFLLLPPLEKMQGKLVIDGLCSRMGRAGASVVSISFTGIAGSVLASAALAGPFVLFIGLSCVIATLSLGKLIETKSVLNAN